MQPARHRKPAGAKPRVLTLEYLESRRLLYAAPTLAGLLAQMTPDPHPSGDMPADTSQLIPLAGYTAGIVPPDPGLAAACPPKNAPTNGPSGMDI